MIDFGILALFTVQLAIAFATFFAWSRVKAEILRLEVLQQKNEGIAAAFTALGTDFTALAKRQADVEEAPRKLLLRFQEVEANIGKADRLLEKLDGKVASLGGRMSAVVKGRKGRGDDDDEVKGQDPEEDIVLPPGVGIPLGPQFEDRQPNQVIPPGFGKSRRMG